MVPAGGGDEENIRPEREKPHYGLQDGSFAQRELSRPEWRVDPRDDRGRRDDLLPLLDDRCCPTNVVASRASEDHRGRSDPEWNWSGGPRLLRESSEALLLAREVFRGGGPGHGAHPWGVSEGAAMQKA